MALQHVTRYTRIQTVDTNVMESDIVRRTMRSCLDNITVIDYVTLSTFRLCYQVTG